MEDQEYQDPRFPQLERLQRTREEIWDIWPSPNRLRTRKKHARDLEELPVDEVFRRINAGEYLE
jgi:hypothetical protein